MVKKFTIVTATIITLLIILTGRALATTSEEISPLVKPTVKTAQANAASPAAQTQQHQQLIKEKIQTLKDKIATQQAEQKIRLTEKIQQKINIRFQKMFNRMDAALERMTNIMDRIDTRLDKLAEKDVDIEELQDQLSIAKNSLDDTQALLTATNTEFKEQVVNSETPKQGFIIIKDTIKQFVTQLKEIHSQLRDIVVQMRVAAGQSENAEQPATDGT